MKTIKIIDLLNKIAKGEEVPKKIKYRNKIYIKRSDCYWYILENGTFDDELFVRIDCLNDEVEIIEEEKEIFPIDFNKEVIKKIEVHVAGSNLDYQLGLALVEIFEKLNELTDAVNELKENK